MDEYGILSIIKDKIGDEYIGDDCAYLKDLDIVVTQDSLIEDIHFKRDWYTPKQLGYKAVIVNISDILASGAVPKYITISLSLPINISSDFVSNFYDGASSALSGAKIIGGDVTGSTEQILISITAIGTTQGRNISSRKNAKEGYSVITKGIHGASAAGLNELLKSGSNNDLILSHIAPKLEYKFSESIASTVKEPYAMMDTSDGIADALFKIAEASECKIIVDYNKIRTLNNISEDQVLFGGEDYKLVAAIPSSYVDRLDCDIIGKVVKYDGTRLDISGRKYNNYSQLKVYNHFSNHN